MELYPFEWMRFKWLNITRFHKWSKICSNTDHTLNSNLNLHILSYVLIHMICYYVRIKASGSVWNVKPLWIQFCDMKHNHHPQLYLWFVTAGACLDKHDIWGKITCAGLKITMSLTFYKHNILLLYLSYCHICKKMIFYLLLLCFFI